MSVYPASHELARSGVFQLLGIVDAVPSITDDALVSTLQERGFSSVDARKLCSFVPSAFAWGLLRRMGLKKFPQVFIALDLSGRAVEFQIGRQHYFSAALDLAYWTLEQGWSPEFSRMCFERVASRSAEMGALNQLLEAGEQLPGAELQPPQVFNFSAEEAELD